jgi:hypothetical protein
MAVKGAHGEIKSLIRELESLSTILAEIKVALRRKATRERWMRVRR